MSTKTHYFVDKNAVLTILSTKIPDFMDKIE